MISDKSVEKLLGKLSREIAQRTPCTGDFPTASPLRYQKWLRLNEARRLMLNEHYDVTTAAYAVGYESLSHFSREYTRMFGQSPKRDITELRESAGKV